MVGLLSGGRLDELWVADDVDLDAVVVLA